MAPSEDLILLSINYDQAAVELPFYLRLNDFQLIYIIAFSVLLLLSAVGNITVLVKLCRLRRSNGLPSRISLFLLHLVVAGLLVTFLMMPIEIAYSAAISWTAGDTSCRVMSVFRVFGLYLSGFLVIAISVDCGLAVLKPLQMYKADLRGKIMFIASWFGAAFCSLPQAFTFHVEPHPQIPGLQKCVTFGSFPIPELHILYVVFGNAFLHSLPLLILPLSYLCVLRKVCAANRQCTTDDLRRSSTEMLQRAKTRTLNMTITIVSLSSIFWLPYNCIIFWYLIDHEPAQQLDRRIQSVLFIIACTGTCFNPVVYGFFLLRKRTKSQEQTQPKPQGRIPKDLRRENSDTAMRTLTWKNHTEPAQSTDPNTTTFARFEGQLRSNEGKRDVSIVFDPQAIG